MDYPKSPLVFVVDGNPIHSSLVKYHLNVNRFFNVHTFPSYSECIYRLGKQVTPDFIVTDYDNGIMPGIDFLKRLRELTPDSKIIFFSSYDDPILAVRLLDNGATDYIVKTNRLDIGIKELVRNMQFLSRELVRL